VADAARRTTDQAQQASRTFLNQSNEINRRLVEAWTGSSAAFWHASFELQSAQIGAGLAWWQAAIDTNRWALQLLDQWDGLVRQGQQAWLETLQASARALANAVDQSDSAVHRAARPSR
jgi:hypothetical protein